MRSIYRMGGEVAEAGMEGRDGGRGGGRTRREARSGGERRPVVTCRGGTMARDGVGRCFKRLAVNSDKSEWCCIVSVA